MPRTSLVSTPRNNWVTETISHVTIRRNGKVASETHLAVPYAAHLTPDGMIEWEWTSKPVLTPQGSMRSTAHQPRRVSSSLWRDFAALADAEAERICGFAARWGPLRQGHGQAGSPDSERLDSWRSFAVLARALVRCWIALKQAKPGEAEDWKVICAWLNLGDSGLAGPAQQHGHNWLYWRGMIGQALNAWYAHSRGHTLVGLLKEKLVIAPATTTLFGIIGIQLAYQITTAGEMLVCYHCSRFFTPKRKSSTGVRNFCPPCRRSAKPQLYAMRDYRSRINRSHA